MGRRYQKPKPKKGRNVPRKPVVQAGTTAQSQVSRPDPTQTPQADDKRGVDPQSKNPTSPPAQKASTKADGPSAGGRPSNDPSNIWSYHKGTYPENVSPNVIPACIELIQSPNDPNTLVQCLTIIFLRLRCGNDVVNELGPTVIPLMKPLVSNSHPSVLEGVINILLAISSKSPNLNKQVMDQDMVWTIYDRRDELPRDAQVCLHAILSDIANHSKEYNELVQSHGVFSSAAALLIEIPDNHEDTETILVNLFSLTYHCVPPKHMCTQSLKDKLKRLVRTQDNHIFYRVLNLLIIFGKGCIDGEMDHSWVADPTVIQAAVDGLVTAPKETMLSCLRILMIAASIDEEHIEMVLTSGAIIKIKLLLQYPEDDDMRMFIFTIIKQILENGTSRQRSLLFEAGFMNDLGANLNSADPDDIEDTLECLFFFSMVIPIEELSSQMDDVVKYLTKALPIKSSDQFFFLAQLIYFWEYGMDNFPDKNGYKKEFEKAKTCQAVRVFLRSPGIDSLKHDTASEFLTLLTSSSSSS